MNSFKEIVKSDSMRLRPPTQQQSPQQERQARMEMPQWLVDALWAIETKFSVRRGMERIDEHDSLAYGKILVSLGEARTRQLVLELRQRYQWRPTVAEVRAVADELFQKETVFDRDVKARRVVSAPKALPPHPDNPARLALKAQMYERAPELRERVRLRLRRQLQALRQSNGAATQIAKLEAELRQLEAPSLEVVSGGLESEAA